MKKLALFLAATLLAACSTISTPTPSPSGTPSPNQTAVSSLQSPIPATESPTSTPVPPTNTPEPTTTPAPTFLQLTSGGCCSQPFFSSDGSQVWYIDHPSEADPAGIWGVSVTGGSPQFISSRPAYYSQDGQYIVYPENNQTYIERLATGERWIPPLVDGRFVSISPDSNLIAWQVNSSVFSFDSRAVDIWVASIDGSNPRQIVRVVGGSLGGWFPDSQRVLITRRDSAGADPFLSVLNLVDGSLTDLVQSRTLRGGLVSPGGGWVAYQITLSGNPESDGFWVIPSGGGTPVRLSTFGPYRWRSEGKLVVVPFEYGAASHRLVEIDIVTGLTRTLTDPATQPFRIANGDWAIAPDGQSIVFLSADDRNLWLISLPNP